MAGATMFLKIWYQYSVRGSLSDEGERVLSTRKQGDSSQKTQEVVAEFFDTASQATCFIFASQVTKIISGKAYIIWVERKQ